MKTSRIYYGEFLKEQEKEYGKLFIKSLSEKEKQKNYLYTLKDIQKHINKEIKIIKKCIGE